MKIGFVLFNGLTFLDFIGFYDVIHRLNLFEETNKRNYIGYLRTFGRSIR